MVELIAEFALVDDVGEPHRFRPVDQPEGRVDVGRSVPDHLQHQELVEIGIEQRPHDRVDAEAVIVDAGRDIERHVKVQWGGDRRGPGAAPGWVIACWPAPSGRRDAAGCNVSREKSRLCPAPQAAGVELCRAVVPTSHLSTFFAI